MTHFTGGGCGLPSTKVVVEVLPLRTAPISRLENTAIAVKAEERVLASIWRSAAEPTAWWATGPAPHHVSLCLPSLPRCGGDGSSTLPLEKPSERSGARSVPFAAAGQATEAALFPPPARNTKAGSQYLRPPRRAPAPRNKSTASLKNTEGGVGGNGGNGGKGTEELQGRS